MSVIVLKKRNLRVLLNNSNYLLALCSLVRIRPCNSHRDISNIQICLDSLDAFFPTMALEADCCSRVVYRRNWHCLKLGGYLLCILAEVKFVENLYELVVVHTSHI